MQEQNETKESVVSQACETSSTASNATLPSKIVVFGGGNGAHVLAALASSRKDTQVSVLALHKDEHSKWSKNIVANTDDGEKIVGNLAIVTDDPAKVIPGAQLILLVVPAFAHEQHIRAIQPYLKQTDKNCILGAMPGAGGFDLMCRSILGEDTMTNITLFTLETLPWACRLTKYGEEVEILGTKKSVDLAVAPPQRTPLVQKSLQRLLGKYPVLNIAGSMLAPQLMAINSVLHPTMTYGAYRNWDGKTPYSKELLFYEGADSWTGDKLNLVSQDVADICEAINSEFPNVDLSGVHSIREWYLKSYGDDIADKSSMHRILNTNKGYKGLKHPMIKVDNGYIPDFTNRYLSEDIPYGLAVIRGVAEIFQVPTPNIDEVLLWGQQKLGKEYLVEGKLSGKDITSTRAPQAFKSYTKESFIRENRYESPAT